MGERMDELKGKVKKGAGKVTGNERLEAQGEREVLKARATRRTKGAVRETGGVVKEGLGALAGDEVAKTEGRTQRRRGRAEQQP